MDEGIKIKFFVKTPGYEFKTEPKTLKFKYSNKPPRVGKSQRL